MPVPPALTATQRQEAFEKSLKLRRTRANIKRYISLSVLFTYEGRVRWAWTYPEAQGMKVYTLLRAVPGVGEATANRLLDEAGIGRHLSVAQCGQRQAERLFGLIDQLPRRVDEPPAGVATAPGTGWF